jgi:hypothetical protein
MAVRSWSQSVPIFFVVVAANLSVAIGGLFITNKPKAGIAWIAYVFGGDLYD